MIKKSVAFAYPEDPLLLQSDNFHAFTSFKSHLTDCSSLHVVVYSAANPKMPVCYFIGQQQKTRIFPSIFFNEKLILNTKVYICSKRQAYSFPFIKNISHQTFSGLSNYHSNRPMLAKLKSLIRPVTDRNSWVIQPRRRHATLLTSLSDIFYKCPATQSYRLNIAPIAFFSTQNSSKLPW